MTRRLTPFTAAVPRRFSPVRCIIAGVAALAMLGGAAPSRGADRAVMLDGSGVEVSVKTIAADGQIIDAQGKPLAADLYGLRRIDRDTARSEPSADAVIYLYGGGLVLVRNLTTDGTFCTFDWAYGQQQRLPLKAVRALLLGTPKFDEQGRPRLTNSSFAAALAAKPDRYDQLFASIEGKQVSSTGLMGLLTTEAMAFKRPDDDEAKQAARTNLYGVVLAPAGGVPDLSGQCLVHLADGSSVWGRLLKLENGKLTLSVGGAPVPGLAPAPAPGLTPELTPGSAAGGTAGNQDGVEMQLPWDAVMRLDVRSPRLVFVSDLDPVNAAVGAPGEMVVVKAPERDGAYHAGQAWRPLKFGDKAYDKGLGVHATTRLTYTLPPGFEMLVGVIALDPPPGVRGEPACDFAVSADGKELFRQRMKKGDQPREFGVKVGGARRVTLTVEPATPFMNMGAGAAWCDARFIRESP